MSRHNYPSYAKNSTYVALTGNQDGLSDLEYKKIQNKYFSQR